MKASTKMVGGCLPLSGPGRVAFPIIIALGAVTGVLSFMFFSQVSPGPLITPEKLFEMPPSAGPATGEIKEGQEPTTTAGPGQQQGGGANSTNQSQSAAIPPDAVTISIPQGASVQGNPAYDPETAQAGIDQTVAWKNDDSTPHTATSGELFDSGIIEPGGSYSIAAEEIGAGEHPYSCTVHPYMKGTLVIK
jgi:cytochrome c oxidase subunit II